jgi:hypothetical protein
MLTALAYAKPPKILGFGGFMLGRDTAHRIRYMLIQLVAVSHIP